MSGSYVPRCSPGARHIETNNQWVIRSSYAAHRLQWTSYGMGRVLNDEPDQLSRAIQIEAAMHCIVCYLRLHPNSADSVRGVRHWLRVLSDELSEETLGLALQRLVERREVEARDVPGGAVVYGRARGLREGL